MADTLLGSVKSRVPKRLVLTPPRGPDGLFIQPKEVGPERELVENHHRHFLASKFNYADTTTGDARTYDPLGNYNCGRCNQYQDEDPTEPPDCLLVEIEGISAKAGSCKYWENLCAGDPEMETEYYNIIEASYGVAANGVGFGCKRCPWGSKAYEPDSRGRNIYCGKGDCRVEPNACCELNGAKLLPMDAEGRVLK